MDKHLVTITYKTANGNRICVEVSTPVKELLEQSDRQIRSQRRQDRRHLDYVDFIGGLSDAAMNHPQVDTADLVMKMESYRQLYAAIGKLPEAQRRRLLLHFVNSLTYRQIAKLEQVDFRTVGRSVERALIQLQKYLTE
ncbi:RNA polymerase sigma factor [Ethanoligenens sp.]|jgi:RNA polymerase sigma factor (sigma-70 family)|uniref:RNA polymerase sigma factor n=1 Tax=Ethanoligenens sp. TaxID=2099655 RepID=UPI0039ECC342